MQTHVPRGERLRPGDLRDDVRAPRLLLRTDSFPTHESWNHDFNSLSPELVALLASRGVRLVGIDTPSVDPFDDKRLESHQCLARHEMANLEGLDLSRVDAGLYTLVALPLRLLGADASPVRAVLLQDDD
jgi:arylformamidase